MKLSATVPDSIISKSSLSSIFLYCANLFGLILIIASSFVIRPSCIISIAIFTSAAAVRLAGLVCKKYNLTSNHNNGEIKKETIKQIQPLYDEIGSVRKVAEKLNISRDTARKYITLKKCNINGDKEWKKSKYINVINWRKRKKLELIEYKGGKCEKCGYKKSTWALEFHHKDPSEKDFGISGKSWSFERLKKEVDKCILVCSNCHHEIHEKINSDKTL